MPVLAACAAVLIGLAVPAASATDGPPAPAAVDDGVVVWTPDAPYTGAELIVTGPDGLELRRTFGAGEPIRLDPSALDTRLPDTFYLYDLTLGRAGADPARQSGAFEIRHGHAVESGAMVVFHATDGSIQGSLCVGNDCAASESFGFDTIRLKENNLRIHFDDTSAAGSFPSTDWEIVLNDSVDGGANYFQVGDRTAGTTPFRIFGGAPTNALWVDANGDVGVGVENAVTEIHVRDGDTPTLRLEQDGTNGWTPQTWDLAGNESNFFVRDLTNGSRLPFKIRPAAPSDQLTVSPSGVGVGVGTATKLLDVDGEALVRGDSLLAPSAALVSARALVGYDDPSGVPASFLLAVDGPTAVGELRVNGPSKFNGSAQFFGDMTGRSRLNFTGDYSSLPFAFRIRDTSLGNANLVFVDNTGNMTLRGTLTQGSDRARKENVLAVDPEGVLAGVVGMEISTWQYLSDSRVHLGPMAQDFHAAFGLGSDPTSIASVDADGVALASVQALHARSEADRARIAELEAENVALAARLARIEALLEVHND